MSTIPEQVSDPESFLDTATDTYPGDLVLDPMCGIGTTLVEATHLGRDARRLDTLIDPTVRGLVALVLTSPPYGATLHGQVEARPGAGVRKSHDRYSRDRGNLAHVGHQRLLDAMGEIRSATTRVLRPGIGRHPRPPRIHRVWLGVR